jgi:hypothetical protein
MFFPYPIYEPSPPSPASPPPTQPNPIPNPSPSTSSPQKFSSAPSPTPPAPRTVQSQQRTHSNQATKTPTGPRPRAQNPPHSQPGHKEPPRNHGTRPEESPQGTRPEEPRREPGPKNPAGNQANEETPRKECAARGVRGVVPPGSAASPAEAALSGEHRATPGGYGGKPPGVAFIGVPTGARNAGSGAPTGDQSTDMNVTRKRPPLCQDPITTRSPDTAEQANHEAD